MGSIVSGADNLEFGYAAELNVKYKAEYISIKSIHDLDVLLYCIIRSTIVVYICEIVN